MIFEYIPNDTTLDAELYLRLAKEYRDSNELRSVPGFEKEVNLICKIDADNKNYISISQVQERMSSDMLESLVFVLKQAETFGITNVNQFRVWIQGNNKILGYPSPYLSAHTHPGGDITDSSPYNTYTVIIPLHIEKTVTEYFWAKWIENVGNTVPFKLKFLNSTPERSEHFKSEKGREVLIPAFREWWDNLRKNTNTEEKIVMLPNIGNWLTLDFNSRSWLHGIDNIEDNLYLIILFDGYKK